MTRPGCDPFPVEWVTGIPQFFFDRRKRLGIFFIGTLPEIFFKFFYSGNFRKYFLQIFLTFFPEKFSRKFFRD